MKRVASGQVGTFLFSALALLLLGLSSCRSVDRMVRISPFMGDSSRERVNLWPLAYHDRDATSVLWPLFDIDSKGFALRPLIAREGDYTSVLFPLAAYDAQKSVGWVVPFYRLEENAGLFPLINFGPTNWIAPVWWRRNPAAHATAGGLFPLAMFGDFNYVGPVWWRSDKDSYGFFPLFSKGELNFYGPVWWWADRGGTRRSGLFPLLWYESHSDSDLEHFSLLPFYSRTQGADYDRRWYLLGLGSAYESETVKQRWLFPFYYSSEKPTQTDTGLLPFFWKRTRGQESHVFTLLGDRRIRSDGSGFNLYPFWWSNESEAFAMRMLLPFFFYEREGDSRSLLTPLGGYGWTGSGDSRYVNVLGPLYHQSRSLDGEEERKAFLWPLMERHRQGARTTSRVLPFWVSTKSPAGRESWYLLGLGHRNNTNAEASFRLWPFYSKYDSDQEPDLLYEWTLYRSHQNGGLQRRRLFPLFSSESTSDEFSLSYLLGLGRYQSGPEKKAWRFWPLAAYSKGERLSGLLDSTTLFGSSSWEGGSSRHFGGPFLYAHSQFKDALLEREHTRLLTFFVREKEQRSGLLLPRGREFGYGNRVALKSSGFFLDAFVSREETYRVWKEGTLSVEDSWTLYPFSDRFGQAAADSAASAEAREILREHGYPVEGADAEALQRSLAEFARENTETIQRSKGRVPLIFSYERTGEEVAWSGPLWLLNSRKDCDSSSFNFLFYGYRSKTEGTRTTRDIFPFVTWDSDLEETEVSFLWRLFRYRRKGDQRGGHILFIPWGDH